MSHRFAAVFDLARRRRVAVFAASEALKNDVYFIYVSFRRGGRARNATPSMPPRLEKLKI